MSSSGQTPFDQYVKKRYGTTATGQRDAARQQRHRAYAERNELLGILARLWPSHLMPPAGKLGELDERWILCVHTPVGRLAYVLEASEVDVAPFSRLERLAESHWDRATRAQRSARLASIISALEDDPTAMLWQPTDATLTPPVDKRGRR